MKLSKKIVVYLLALAIVFSNFSYATVDTQAAAKTKTTTNVYDSKKGVCYPSKIRVGVNSVSNYSSHYVYLLNEGDYVASVKTNSSKLIAKPTSKYIGKGTHTMTTVLDGQESPQFKARYGISFYASDYGTYTATVTIKNSKKKTVCKKKITVYVTQFSYPFKSVKYAGKDMNSYVPTKSKSGKISVAMNKGYKLEKIEVGTYKVDKKYENYSAEPEFKTVKNKQTINLATSTRYVVGASSYSSNWYSYESGYTYDYLLPVTIVKITYKDTKLGISQTQQYNLYYEN